MQIARTFWPVLLSATVTLGCASGPAGGASLYKRAPSLPKQYRRGGRAVRLR